MHTATEFASVLDLLDRMLDKGIVVDMSDRVRLSALDLPQQSIRVVISSIQIILK